MIYKPQIWEEISAYQEKRNLKSYEKLMLTVKACLKKEEKFHKKHAVPDAEYHENIHNELVRDLESFKDQFFTDKKKIKKKDTNMICHYIRSWIILHEKKCDQFIESFIRIEDYIKDAA